tara:strand:+ start:381 stop:635 length:255 start_codon:yes stop_codon:yes gene_type:complete
MRRISMATRDELLKADLVAHGGPSASGGFVQTLTLTDVATGSTECAALLFREQHLLGEVMTSLRAALPLPLLGHRHGQRQRVHE